MKASCLKILVVLWAVVAPSLGLSWTRLPEHLQNLVKPDPRTRIYYQKDQNYLRKFKLVKRLRYESGPDFVQIKDELPLREGLAAEEFDCYLVFKTGGDVCWGVEDAPVQADYDSLSGELDLLMYARRMTDEYGIKVARDRLKQKIKRVDRSGGLFLDRAIKTTQNPSFVYPDSLANIPMSKRSSIGVYFVLGFGADTSPNSKILQAASDEINKLGFSSKVLNVSPELGSDHNSQLIYEQIKKDIDRYERVILVGVSKGVADYLHFLNNYDDVLSKAQRLKIRSVFSLCGIVRTSVVANFLYSNDFMAKMMRLFIKLTGRGSSLETVKSLSQNFWKIHGRRHLSQNYPNLKWVSVPALPEGKDGHTYQSDWADLFTPYLVENLSVFSPYDGLVETAASMLPPGTGIPEWVIPITGPHSIVWGKFNQDVPLAPKQYASPDEVVPEAGGEVLSAFFRALPQELLE